MCIHISCRTLRRAHIRLANESDVSRRHNSAIARKRSADGFSRADLLAQGNVKTIESSISDYREGFKAFNRLLLDKNHAQSGDPKKGVAIVVDLVRQEGVAKDKTVPLRMPSGS